MSRKPAYDPEPLNRFRYTPDAVEATMERVTEGAIRPLTETLNAQAADLADTHGIPSEVAALWLADQMKKVLVEQRTYRAARAHHAGVPKTGVAEVLGWRGGAASAIRRMPQIDTMVDQISDAATEAARAGQPVSFTLDSGYTDTIHPAEVGSQ